jgi:hypothetical protein
LHSVDWARALPWAKAGKSNPAKIAIIAITTNSSINVNALELPARPFGEFT